MTGPKRHGRPSGLRVLDPAREGVNRHLTGRVGLLELTGVLAVPLLLGVARQLADQAADGQGLRTTFPWVFWGFHGKYKILI